MIADHAYVIWSAEGQILGTLEKNQCKVIFSRVTIKQACDGKPLVLDRSLIQLPYQKTSYCIICKTRDNLTKHHVVPRRILRVLPQWARNHVTGVIATLCRSCHDKYDLKKKNKFNVPMPSSKNYNLTLNLIQAFHEHFSAYYKFKTGLEVADLYAVDQSENATNSFQGIGVPSVPCVSTD